jgi:4-diphosphocytidyl-2-C-methyl-D-erythritol kinase
VRVPGKVNLHLGVGPRRDDGYHELVTVYQAVGLYDDVTAASGPGVTVAVTGEGAAEVPADGRNLAVRAAQLLAERCDTEPAVRLTVRKAIPVAAGMAGGSADAAAALVACDALWGTGLTRDELGQLASELGSDVPFLLHGGTSLGTGRGEQLTPVLARGSYEWVLALATGGLSTAEVYAEHDRGGDEAVGTGTDHPAGVLAALRGGDALALGRALTNDLQAAALRLRPPLARVLDAAVELGALGALVSGSGPTVALLARSSSDALSMAASLAGLGVCRTVRRASGPVPGARVVPPGGSTAS